jgi:hypothetical protein
VRVDKRTRCRCAAFSEALQQQEPSAEPSARVPSRGANNTLRVADSHANLTASDRIGIGDVMALRRSDRAHLLSGSLRSFLSGRRRCRFRETRLLQDGRYVMCQFLGSLQSVADGLDILLDNIFQNEAPSPRVKPKLDRQFGRSTRSCPSSAP